MYSAPIRPANAATQLALRAQAGREEQEISRGRFYSMQTLSGRGPTNAGRQTSTIAFLAVLFFALSGLISGFAVGAFIRSPIGQGSNSVGGNNQPAEQKGKTPIPSSTSEVVWPGEPQITNYSSPEIANGSTSYTFSALIADKLTNKILQASSVTCKLWLTKDGDVNDVLRADNYAIPKSISTIQQPFPQEVVNGLTFTTAQQTQACTPNGKTTWHYNVSSSVNPGTYYLVVLADWKGKHYNWSWMGITIKQEN